MSYDYNALYAEIPDALGAPTEAFVQYFEKYSGPPLRVFDAGCGQGRDALFIARLGHSVVGVDIAGAGIAQLAAAAKAEGLPITAVADNIITYEPDGRFDILLIDRTLHMIADTDERHACFGVLLGHLAPGGTLLLADEPSNMIGLRAVMDTTGRHWTTLIDKGGLLFAQG